MNASTSARLRNQSAQVVDDVAEDAGRLGNQANEEMGRLIADVEDLVGRLARVSDTEVVRLREKIEKTLEAARQSMREGAAQVQARGRRAAQAADGYVHERPWTALGLAAAVGVLLGALAARR
jgi:ElaB/YqjD/DUF883 family membrane-anchored ribosome-binding protein